MKVIASLKNLRTSPRKVRLVTDSISGMNTNAALVHLAHTVKKTSEPVIKLLSSAVANAENNFGLDKDNLYVESIMVGEGARLKRWLPRAQGRATLLLKRTSHIKLVLEEREEGKNRKTKEQMEKERKAREDAKKKMIEAEMKEMEKQEKEEKEEVASAKRIIEKGDKKKEVLKKGQDSGFLKKVFQRKSGA